MKKRGAGVLFITIGVFLISIRYLSAALIGSGVKVSVLNNSPDFDSLLTFVGSGLSNFAIVVIIVGVLFIAWAEIEVKINE
ncbi:hypothetical protein [Oceanobacillus jeddahense]|uniref:Uncharacterized protein n=1 Tax=Oceanobacillus jeddahense TaxID=1462527 RepID=A0ABY5JS19_9BACI|nr:hypothetical protein [Oceanobacillus jeddahense]UUI01404.1 hypothetical protein NP439_15240 [Oceanobacillus jeddahense]